MRERIRGFRKGAASFYIVAFSTLILVIIATSFATVIISEVTRTMNDDLSQSAYDAALAGVEDAKLAFSNYRRCLSSVNPDAVTDLSTGDTITCQDIVYWMKNPNCDMVAHILGRIEKRSEGGEVMVSDTTEDMSGGQTDMNQAYTCVKIETVLADYRANLSSSNQVKVVKVQFENTGAANQISQLKFSWYSNRENETPTYLNFSGTYGNRVTFMPVNQLSSATPPTMALELIQTSNSFSIDDFNVTNGSSQTDRATVFLVPTQNASYASSSREGNYVGVYSGGKNTLSVAQVAKSNDHMISNVPYAVYCDPRSKDEFMCSATINLPRPVGNYRSDDTFMFVVTLPYGEPDTDFAMQFLCGDGVVCSATSSEVSGTVTTSTSNVARIKGVQVTIDSTGRANDLYRRVETRLESADTSFPYPYYALQLLDSSRGAVLLEKNMTVTNEVNFYR